MILLFLNLDNLLTHRKEYIENENLKNQSIDIHDLLFKRQATSTILLLRFNLI